MRPRLTHRQKTRRAMEAYMDLIDTADWLKGELRVPLESFDLTMGELRVLELLHRRGALTTQHVMRARRAKKENVKRMVKRLEGRGWVARRVVTLPPVAFEESHRAKSRKGERRRGKPIGVVVLTASGKNFIRDVLPRHSKLVKSLFRVLGSREQLSLSRLCRKLRAGDIFKFLREIQMVDEEQEALELREKAMAQLERLTARTGMRRVESSEAGV
ncbi:MAG TPA: MarR family transcriptional regulator [Candidatus Aquilonibacter sp.]|nr:MarR family transcriptional regulator [Candidatus Aquilonibacter sp.]